VFEEAKNAATIWLIKRLDEGAKDLVMQITLVLVLKKDRK
jgi:hypothetical protein